MSADQCEPLRCRPVEITARSLNRVFDCNYDLARLVQGKEGSYFLRTRQTVEKAQELTPDVVVLATFRRKGRCAGKIEELAKPANKETTTCPAPSSCL
jgi:hypothetical protein